MSVVIKLLSAASGLPTEFDGQYLVEFDPSKQTRYGHYPPEVLKVSPDIAQAKRFEHSFDAMREWRTQQGTRPDGRPNRPLTAWHVEIVRVDP